MIVFISIMFILMIVWFIIATIIELVRIRNRVIQTGWIANDKEKARSMLAKDILAAKKRVHIISGNANKEIYDDNDVLTAFRTAIENDKIEIKIIFSQTETSAKKLQQLFIKKKNSKFIPADIIPKTHFRIIDSKCVYMEKPHDENIESKREFRYIKEDPLAGHIFEKKFKELLSICKQ